VNDPDPHADAAPERRTVLVTGATGYVGGRLLAPLLHRGHTVRALARSPDPDVPRGVEVHRGDVVAGEGLDAALDGVAVAYYLIHSMGRGSGSTSGFAERDRTAAANFGAAAARRGVGRVIYLGGLEDIDDDASAHLRSRREVAGILHEHVPGTVHVRAAMVIGAGSASFVMLKGLVERLPVMVVPRWLDTRTQPVAIADVVATLVGLAEHPDPPAEVQLGGADVVTYREMMSRYARATGRRPPAVVKVPLLSPGLSSWWVSLVTPVELGLVRPLVQGMASEMVVREPPPDGINDAPRGFDDAVREALQG
jgi:uncharacterized protein YbjT (DUF2867 family)